MSTKIKYTDELLSEIKIVRDFLPSPSDLGVKIAWLTDIHLNFVGRDAVELMCESVRLSGADMVLITGDIATSIDLCEYLEFLADEIRKPIYFVLGNHDYYHSSIKQMNIDVAKAIDGHLYLSWLSQAGIICLTPDTCLIGHEGWADGRLGDPEGSQVVLNDYRFIKDLAQPTKDLRLAVQHKLGDEAAEYLDKQVSEAVTRYKKIIVALHAPPFREACWHEDHICDDNYLPHFGCKATGAVLKAAMLAHPEVSMRVYCGHTHSGGHAQILSNLEVITAGAEYYKPRIAGIIQETSGSDFAESVCKIGTRKLM